MANRPSVSYRWRGGALLRATTDPGGLDLPRDLDRGAFRLCVTGTPRPCSSMAGRFAHLLTDQERGELARTYQEDLPPHTITAQMSFPP